MYVNQRRTGEGTRVEKIINFDSVDELIKYGKGATWYDYSKFGDSINSVRELLTKMSKPDPPSLNRFKRLEEQLSNEVDLFVPDTRRKLIWTSDDGDELDRDRLQSGQDYWRATQRKHKVRSLTATVFIDISASVSVSSSKFIWRGVAGALLSKRLEAAGYSTEVFMTAGARTGDSQVETVNMGICLKRHGDTFDVSTFINSLTDWFYRTAYFTAHAKFCNTNGVYLPPGLGFPAPFGDSQMEYFSNDSNRFYIRRVMNGESAKNLVLQEIKKVANNESS